MNMSYKEVMELMKVQETMVNLLVRITVIEKLLIEKNVFTSEEYVDRTKELSQNIIEKINDTVKAANDIKAANPVEETNKQ